MTAEVELDVIIEALEMADDSISSIRYRPIWT
jgi:hypothetical protein